MLKERAREKPREKKAEEKARKEEERAKKSRTVATKVSAHPSGFEDPNPKRVLRDCTNVSSSGAKRRRGDTEDTDSNKCCVCLVV